MNLHLAAFVMSKNISDGSFTQDRSQTASPSTAEKNPRTSQDEGASAPSSESASSNPTSSASLSPFTPGEEPQNTTPVTPTGQPDHPVVRKSLNPVKLFPSAKRLAFWNFSSFSEERSVKPAFDTEAASVSLPRDCPSRIDEVSLARREALHYFCVHRFRRNLLLMEFLFQPIRADVPCQHNRSAAYLNY